jgi:hypothetical protein
MISVHRLLPLLLCLLFVPLVGCSPSGWLSGAAEADGGSAAGQQGVRKPAASGIGGPVAALEGFDGEIDPWGEIMGERVEPSRGYTLIGVADPAAVLVLDEDLAVEVDAVVREFSASGTGNRGSGQSGTAIYLAERFATAGGLGTTRFRFVGTAARVIAQ